jgi:diguanylate cyclase (GGDEF)-like protein
MRISTITNWAYGFTLLLTGLSGAAFLMAANAADRERASVEQHLRFDGLADDLAEGTDKLTDEARFYAMGGADRHLQAYRLEATEVRTRDRAIEAVRSAGASAAELAAIAEAERNLGELNRLESSAVETVQSGDQKQAQQVLFGPEHERAQAMVLGALDHFRALTASRTEAGMRQARRMTDITILIAKVMLAITALLFLGVLYFVLRRRVSVPLTQITGIVARLARQDYAVEVPNDRRRDEIGDITTAIQVFRENGLERERLEKEREADQRAKDSILQMMHRLQACETRQELAEVVACFAPQTFPALAGRLYVFDDNRNALSLVSTWLDPIHSTASSFAPTACWGLRRGRPHISLGAQQDVCCPHVNHVDAKTLCVPLTAQGDTIGLLYFEERPNLAGHQEAQRLYLELMSDNIALALANLRLRERLADLAVRDALTGLNNRRSLDETLSRHTRSSGAVLACIMIDIDYFKHFNDEFGHDAGDAVMQHVAQVMLTTVGDAGGAYRFGGEEFTVILPDASEAAAFDCAERLRNEIAAAPLAHHGRMLGNVTISLGLAVSPNDGPPATLLSRADAALLRAKSSGRNRTMKASETASASTARPAA